VYCWLSEPDPKEEQVAHCEPFVCKPKEEIVRHLKSGSGPEPHQYGPRLLNSNLEQVGRAVGRFVCPAALFYFVLKLEWREGLTLVHLRESLE
jgi:hypothetical protein